MTINPFGIFEFGSYREVHQYEKFWSLGSGRQLALGAMHALYDLNTSAQDISEAGVRAAAEFNDSCNTPIQTIVLDMDSTDD